MSNSARRMWVAVCIHLLLLLWLTSILLYVTYCSVSYALSEMSDMEEKVLYAKFHSKFEPCSPLGGFIDFGDLNNLWVAMSCVHRLGSKFQKHQQLSPHLF